MEQFRLNTNITADFLAQVETRLDSIFHERLLQYQDRFYHPKVYPALFAIAKLLSLLGLVVSLLVLVTDYAAFKLVGRGIGFTMFFLLTLALTWDAKKLEEKRSRFFRPYWAWLAKNRANGMLKRAKKLVSFVAEYDFRGDLGVYYRTKNEKSKFIWARQISGYRLTGSGFTLLYKKEKSTYPYGIILHDISQEFESYLDELGVRPFDRPVPACGNPADPSGLLRSRN